MSYYGYQASPPAPKIIDSSVIRSLFNDAVGYEPNVIRFWHAIINKSFLLEENYVVSPEQFVSYEYSRGDSRRVDTLVEYFDENTQRTTRLMFCEAKRENEPAKKVEDQALMNAKTMLSERGLTNLYVLTTIGTRFRTWVIYPASNNLQPLFGGRGHNGSEYLSADTSMGDSQWQYLVDNVKSGHSGLEPDVYAGEVRYEDEGGESSRAAVRQDERQVTEHWVTPKLNGKTKKAEFKWGGKKYAVGMNAWQKGQGYHYFYSEEDRVCFCWKI